MLPHAIALTEGVSLTTVDYVPIQKQATADATGTATVALDPVEPGYMWLVDALSVRSNSTADTRTLVWAGARLMDGSDSGNFDFSDRNSPVLVVSSEVLQIVWTGATPGAVCNADGQYRLILKG